MLETFKLNYEPLATEALVGSWMLLPNLSDRLYEALSLLLNQCWYSLRLNTKFALSRLSDAPISFVIIWFLVVWRF